MSYDVSGNLPSGRDQLRQALIKALTSDEWMERHFGIVAHAHDVIDALLPVIDAHVQAERERIAAAIWDDEQRCQSAIVDDPTSVHLNGRLAGLQRARDIASRGGAS
jgi:hypothetical protein